MDCQSVSTQTRFRTGQYFLRIDRLFPHNMRQTQSRWKLDWMMKICVKSLHKIAQCMTSL